FNVFILINNKYIHYLRAGDSITPEKLQQFQSKAPDNFYIHMSDKQTYKDYVSKTLKKESLSPKEKAVILRESSMALIEELFESPDIERALQESKEVINQFLDVMDSEPEAMAHLIGLSNHDFYTYTHSLDVGIYSLGLAQVVGYRGSDLQEMGQGALFHDIGKRQVDVDIICKNGPLDEMEWSQMQKHPEYGLQILSEHDVSDAIKACCFEHHESFKGNGYPQQLSGEEIHPMARIVALTDTFDALTTQRSYNKPMLPTKALEFMKERLKGRYDEDLLKAMYHVLFQMEQATSQ
ncbi:MAG: HD domain-containing protein, partial [Bdellovibrio sp.]